MAMTPPSAGALFHHEIRFKVRACEAGPFGVIRLASFLDYFQEAAGEHAGLLGGIGPRAFSSKSSPGPVQVTMSSSTGTRSGRDGPDEDLALNPPESLRPPGFEAVEDGGEVIARGTSSWMVIDLAARARQAGRAPGDLPQDPTRALADEFPALPS